MPTVYRILPDVDTFQYILSENVKSLRKYNFDGVPLRQQWDPPESFLPFPTRPEPDFWGCFMYSSVFAVARQTIETFIGTFVDQSCEELPLRLPDRELTILNVTHVLNCLDQSKSEFDPELPRIIDKYVFHKRRFTCSLFKIPETAKSEVLCVEGLADTEGEFKGLVESLGLTGLRFHQLWTDE